MAQWTRVNVQVENCDILIDEHEGDNEEGKSYVEIKYWKVVGGKGSVLDTSSNFVGICCEVALQSKAP